MNPERWREIGRLYYAVLERDAVERSAFLDEACGGDEALRREVESLFAYQTRANDFIEAPAARVHLGLLSRVLTPVRAQVESAAAGRFVGRVLGVYDVKALIGAGGMGEVYRAVDTRLNRPVAIKVLPEQVSHDPERRERLQREARIISTLNHPHICALYDVGSQDGVDYLVMEHIDGETLQARLQQGALPLPRALEYGIQICDALDKAHRRGVTHRDLKPANVMLTKAGAKLLDFGAATSSTSSDEIASEILGTLQYMAPEQLEGKQADGRTDIFAFGAVLYEAITGTKAWRGASPASLIGAILKDDAPPVADLVPQIPPPLAQAIARCLSKDPDERWQTASDLLFQLRSIASASPTVESRPSRRLTIERAAWAAAVVAAVFITLAWTRAVTKGEGSHFWPQVLTDGEHFIYAATRPASLNVGSLGGGAPRTLMKFPVRVSALAYVPGYVFFVQDDALFARAFDEARLEFSGDAMRIAEGIPVTGPGRASFSVSPSGVLAYWPYPVGTPAVLRWFERDGRTSPLLDAPAQYVGFALSPDDRQLVFSRVTSTGGADVWLRDLGRGSESQLTSTGRRLRRNGRRTVRASRFPDQVRALLRSCSSERSTARVPPRESVSRRRRTLPRAGAETASRLSAFASIRRRCSPSRSWPSRTRWYSRRRTPTSPRRRDSASSWP